MIVNKLFKFEASHILPMHPGKCSRLHGHSWRVEVSLEGDVDNSTGFVLDYADLKKVVQPIVDRLDHRHLNCFLAYPSSENVAAYFAHEIRAQVGLFSSGPFRRLVVRVSETEPTWAIWDSSNKRDLVMLDYSEGEAGWKDPIVLAIPVGRKEREQAMKLNSEIAAEHFRSFQNALIKVEQLRLFEERQTVTDVAQF